MAGTFVEAFLDGFAFPGVFRRARRPGAPTQVFASEGIEPMASAEPVLLQVAADSLRDLDRRHASRTDQKAAAYREAADKLSERKSES